VIHMFVAAGCFSSHRCPTALCHAQVCECICVCVCERERVKIYLRTCLFKFAHSVHMLIWMYVCMHAGMSVLSLVSFSLPLSLSPSFSYAFPLTLAHPLFLAHSLLCMHARALQLFPTPSLSCLRMLIPGLTHWLSCSFTLLLSQEKGYVDLQSGDGKACVGIDCDNCKCSPTVPTDAFWCQNVSPNAYRYVLE